MGLRRGNFFGKKIMSLTGKVAFNTFVQVAGKIVTTVISLFLVLALTRYLGVSGYGQYTTALAYMAFFSVLADFGFFWILIREIAHPENDINKVTSNIFTLRTVLGIVVYGLAFGIGYFIPQYADFRWGLGIAALASFFLTLNSTYVGVFQNKLHMEKAAITDVIGRAIILAITLYFIRQNMGLSAVLWAYAVGNMINFALSFLFGRAYVNFRFAFDFPYWKKVFLQALPMGVTLVLGLIYFRIDTLMLSLMKSSTDVGIYGPPYKVLEILLFFPSIFMGNVFPIITRYIYEKDPRVESAVQKSFDFLFLIAAPIVIGLIMTAKAIIYVVSGNEFVTAHTLGPVFGLPATSVSALQILSVAVGFSFISHLFGYLVVAIGQQKKLVWPNIIFVIVNIGLNLILIPKYSYIAAAVVTVITEGLVLFFSWLVAQQNLKLKLGLDIVYRVLISSAVMGAFLYFFGNFLSIFLLIPLAAFIYLMVLWLLKGFDFNMVREIAGLRKGEAE